MRKVIVIIALLVVALLFTFFGVTEILAEPTSSIKKTCNVSVTTHEKNKVYNITPKNNTYSKTIMYLHGGAYMGEMTKDHWDFLEKLVQDTNSRIIMPDYPLTPRYTYKDVFKMVENVYNEYYEEDNFILMGDSAGGGIVAGLLEKVEKAPSKSILISPWLDVSMSNPKMVEIQKNDKDLTIDKLKVAGRLYAGSENDLKNPLVSPIYGDVSKLNNVVILSGTYDILWADCSDLKSKNENINLKEYEGASHIWIIKKNCDHNLVKKGYEDLISEVKNSWN